MNYATMQGKIIKEQKRMDKEFNLTAAGETGTEQTENHTATISNAGSFAIFQFGKSRLKFAALYSLEYYDSVVQ